MQVLDYRDTGYWIEHVLSEEDYTRLYEIVVHRGITIISNDSVKSERFGILVNLDEVKLVKEFFENQIEFQHADYIYFVNELLA